MHCSVCGGGGEGWEESVSIKRVQDLPERNTAEVEGAVEAPEGKRSRNYVAEEGEKRKGEKVSEDQRSSVSGIEAVSERRARTRSMALFSARRHSFTLRKVWTWARAGKACVQEERDTERGRQREHAGSRPCRTERYSYRDCSHIRSYRHAPTQQHRQGKSKKQSWGIYQKYLHKQIFTQQRYFERKYHKLQQSEKSYEASSTWICAHQRWALLGRSEVLTYYYMHRTAKKME